MAYTINPTHKLYKKLFKYFKIVEINYSKEDGWILETIDSTYFLGITLKEAFRNIDRKNFIKQ